MGKAEGTLVPDGTSRENRMDELMRVLLIG
jgi:hypothetical protein